MSPQELDVRHLEEMFNLKQSESDIFDSEQLFTPKFDPLLITADDVREIISLIEEN